MKPMTKQRIGQYNSLKREIAMLEEQICKAKTSGSIVVDVVQSSMRRPPYAQRSIVIEGYGSRSVPKLAARKARCVAECDAIERFIDGVEDSTMRQLFTRRYIEGRHMKEAAKLVGYSERQAIRLLNDFFESCHPASCGVT